MNPAANAITNLYRLEGDAFDRRFAIMVTNIKGRMLEDFVSAPPLHSDAEELLGDLSAAIIQTQKTACQVADITDEQKRDFGDRLDSFQADAVIAIRECYATFGERTSVEFQMEAARRLGIPLA